MAVVIPAHDEAAAIAGVVRGVLSAGTAFPLSEVIVTDDGSRDSTARILAELAAEEPRLTVVTHPRAAGQSAAIHSAVRRATAPVVAMLDGDGQNPPEDLPKLIAPFLDDAPARLGLVAGQRVGRRDTLSKRLASGFANRLRGALLQDGTRDTGCGLKAFRRDAFLMLPYFDHMHRYLPALFQRDGWEVRHVDVGHRPREGGRSKYTNLGRGLVGAVDLVGVSWLIRRRKRALTPADLLAGGQDGPTC
ncbi:glycosyltransferase family 2 protein [Histidinibacterium lentulum]|uniref:glycosyltransferase family 2 protein n=1 Tax=Histidinibacterium lentulum TaxID=2480588 RepID=UPI00319EAD08